MTKSKAKSSIIRSSMDDFCLQSKRHTLALHTPRVPSRSCFPVHPPSPTFTPPHTKVAFADFTDFSSVARVLSRQKNISMHKKGSLTPSLCYPSPTGHNGGFSCSSKAINLATDHNSKSWGVAHPSRSCPSSGCLSSTSSTIPPTYSFVKSHPYVICPRVSPSPVGATLASPVLGKPQPGGGSSPLIDNTPGSPHSLSPAFVHFPAYTSSASYHL